MRGLGGEVAERLQHRPHLESFMGGSNNQLLGSLLGQPVDLEAAQGLGGLGEPASQQGKQGIGDGRQIPLLVAAGVGVQIQAWLAIDADLHLYGEILHRAGADVENMGTEGAKPAGMIERHDVDQGAEQPLDAPHQAKVSAQQLVAVVLVLAHAALGLGHGAGRPRQIQFFTKIEGKGGNVHLHAGHCQRRRADAVHHHQAEQDLALAACQGELGREAGQQQIGPAQLVLVGKAGQGLPERRGQRTALADKFGGDGRAGVTKGLHLGPALQLLLPEAAGGGVLAALLAARLFRQHLRQRTEGGWGVHLTGQPLCIQLGDALEQQGGAKAIESDVVHAAVEVIAAGAAQQGEAAGSLFSQFERAAQIGPGPAAGDDLVIAFKVHLVIGEWRLVRDEADRLPIVFEVALQRLALPYSPGEGGHQHGSLDLAVEGDALGGVEHRLVVIEQMSGPEPLLGYGQREAAHCTTSRFFCSASLASIRRHQPLRVGSLAKSTKPSSTPAARHSVSRDMIRTESRP
ncbi:hypothetical protein D3C77_361640 [compost metagenome]